MYLTLFATNPYATREVNDHSSSLYFKFKTMLNIIPHRRCNIET